MHTQNSALNIKYNLSLIYLKKGGICTELEFGKKFDVNLLNWSVWELGSFVGDH